MQNFWGWLFDKAELNDKMPLNLPNKFKDEYERFLGTKIIATNNERMGKKPMRVIQTRLTTIDMEENKIGRTRQTLWRAVQMLTQKLCCQTIHDCPKVVPLHYESE